MVPMWRQLWGFAAAISFFLVVLVASRAEAAPSVKGPISGKPALTLGSYEIDDGYVTEEFFISGTARSYQLRERPQDGRWAADVAATAPFATRIVVIRPKDGRKFNGTAVVEWLNVSLGADTAADWLVVHRELLRSGYAYVGVSAQKVGVDGGTAAVATAKASPLTLLDPSRYSGLHHPGDAFSFDIFSQAGAAVRGAGGVSVLGSLKLRHVLAIGESQSAAFLTTYYNAIQPLDKVYDGFLIHSRGGFSAPIDGGRLMPESNAVVNPVTLRTDLNTPVLTVLTETDVEGRSFPGFFRARQPDTDRIRAWEIPGTAHADIYIWRASQMDSGKESIAQLAAAFAPTRDLMGTQLEGPPINTAPQHHYVMEAALSQLHHWIEDGRAPPTAMPIEIATDTSPQSRPALVLDENGNARGGVRTPWVDVPVAKLSGSRSDANTLAAISGSTEVFDSAKLARLYPGGRTEYLKKFTSDLSTAVKNGFILKQDVPEISALAAYTYPSN